MYINLVFTRVGQVYLFKGLRAESARAVTGRRCPHSGEGEDFLMRRLAFFYEIGHNSGTKSRKIASKVGNKQFL